MKFRKITLLPVLAAMLGLAMPAMAQDYPTNFGENDFSQHGSRYLRSVQVAPEGAAAHDISVSSGPMSKMYYPLTSEVVTVEPGQNVTLQADYVGEWMHAYAYLDFGNDGQFSYEVDENNHTAKAGSDLVTFSFYSFDPNADTYGYNSVGRYITGDNRSTLLMPSFKAPEQAGDYRVRVKIDWNSIDPAGCADATNPISRNGGAIVDFTLRVASAEPPAAVGAMDVTALTSRVDVEKKAVILSWTNPVNDVNSNPLTGDVKLKIYRNDQFVNQVTGTPGDELVLEYKPDNYDNGQVYTIKTLYNDIESQGASVTVDFPVIPKEVRNLMAVPDVDSKEVSVGWINPGKDIFGRSLTDDLVVKIFWGEKEICSYDGQMPNNFSSQYFTPETYEGKQIYLVKVFAGENASAGSELEITFPAAAPAEVTELVGEANGYTEEVTLIWNNPAEDVLGRKLETIEVKVYEGEDLLETIGTAMPGEQASYTFKPAEYTGTHTYKVVVVSQELESAGATVDVKMTYPDAIGQVAGNNGMNYDAATGQLYVEDGAAVRVFDLQGRQLACFAAQSGVVNLADIPAGAYVVRVVYAAGHSLSFKLVK